jgi:stage II sporulation protein M
MANKKGAKRMAKKKSFEKNKFNLWNEYRKSWDYIKDSGFFIFLIIGIFIFFILLGFFIPVPSPIYNAIISYIKELIAKTENLSQINTILFIISNNVQSTFFSLLFGVFLGIFPLFTTIINGYVLGFVSSVSVANGGILTLWKLLPHGIFELPAVFIALGLGLRTGMFAFQKDRIKSLRNYLVNSFRVFLLVIIPLLVIAGIIEGTLVFILK